VAVDIRLDLLPVPLVVADLLAVGADGQHAGEHLDPFAILLQGPQRFFQLAVLQLQLVAQGCFIAITFAPFFVPSPEDRS